MKKILFISIFILGLTGEYLHGQQPGTQIPDSDIEIVLQAQVNSISSLSMIRNKWILLEFWGTWCAPCIAKIPSLNQIQEDLKNENIQFISITWEDQKIVKKFLKRKPINGWIGIDSDRSLINALKVQTYPTTILIDTEGIIHSYLTTEKLSTAALLDIIHSQPFSDSNKEAKRATSISETVNSKRNASSSRGQKVEPIYSVSIQPTQVVGNMEMGIFSKQFGKVQFKGLRLSKLLSQAYGISQFQVVGSKDLLEKRYDVDVNLPKGRIDVFEKILQSAITDELKISVKKKTQSIKVLALTAPNGAKNFLYESQSNEGKFSWSNGNMAGVGLPIEGNFLNGIGEILGVEVLNRTGLDGRYDFNLFWNEADPTSIKKALKDQLGLILDETEEVMEVLLIVEK